MNDRLQIAAMCLQGLMSNSGIIDTFLKSPSKEMIQMSLDHADALIEQEKATRPKEEIKICPICKGCGFDHLPIKDNPCKSCNGTGVER